MPSFARMRAGRSVISWPANSIVPDDGGKSPEITLKSVVLPAPFGPRIARRSPYATSRSTSRTASSPPNRRPIPRRERIGPPRLTGTASPGPPPPWLGGPPPPPPPPPAPPPPGALAEPRQRPLLAARGVAARSRRRAAER